MLVQDGFEDLQHLVDFLGGDVERRDEADDVRAGGGVEGAGFDEGDGEVDRGQFAFRDVEFTLVELGSEEESDAINAGDGGVIPGGYGVADLLFSLFDVFNEVFGDDRLHNGERCRAGEGISSIGGAMTAGAEKRSVFFADPESTDGKSSAHAFGPGDGVGLDVGCDGFPAVDFSGPTEAGLDFV